MITIAAAVEAAKTVRPDHTGMIIGAGAALCGGILTAGATFLTSFFAHRWESKRERVREKRAKIDRLVAVSQEALEVCVTFRADLTERILNHKKFKDSPATPLIQEATRIAMLYARECQNEVDALQISVGRFTMWAIEFGEQLIAQNRDLATLDNEDSRRAFSEHLAKVNDAVNEIANRGREILQEL